MPVNGLGSGRSCSLLNFHLLSSMTIFLAPPAPNPPVPPSVKVLGSTKLLATGGGGGGGAAGLEETPLPLVGGGGGGGGLFLGGLGATVGGGGGAELGAP